MFTNITYTYIALAALGVYFITINKLSNLIS